MNRVEERAPAKINLHLDVIGRRSDGYHRLETIMQSISLYDRLLVAANKNRGDRIKLEVRGKELPADRDNLVWQAASLMMNKFAAVKPGLEIVLDKKIPVAAGLAGGSTDAAAVLRAVNRLFDLGLSRSGLEKLGAELGADVPFCISGGTALARGAGEKITPLSPLLNQPLVLVKPPFSVSTRQIFAEVSGRVDREGASASELVELIEEKVSISWQEGWHNALESFTCRLYPRVCEIKEKLESFDPLHVQMTGSGPTVMAFFDEKRRAEEVKKTWSEEDDEVYALEFVK
ncbi:4-(cytidine 5'-diphospho)-2-C-methyl-D-erythritol kinase [Halarsenatibacter silvermanii]|uniref:4-diphosphocytidyl-2-C-methyl-D-erythritol kinase n=1 Tax=Halarsenatibacter silvermanii TaxID=321763 RepID=A0A1G9QE06_9FIRM|nr:4-(cytidine 5'-diphospho)-2-C-methyl-D-erythritol kinase [Halarsenatibacter silvermanii]SDM09203.1 4-diphosphocytidyl-2-C-methyl-D-erythritol kinase [Halarsenatibacter silvermanii]